MLSWKSKYSLVFLFKSNCWKYPSQMPTNNNRAANTKINFIFASRCFSCHWTKKRIYTKFVQRKYDANICFLQSKAAANMVNATFAIILTQVCKYGSKCGIYHLCCSFALEETYVCNLLALYKFGLNPFFRPVSISGQLFCKLLQTSVNSDGR